MFAESAFRMALLRLAMAPCSGFATVFGTHPSPVKPDLNRRPCRARSAPLYGFHAAHTKI